jgi:hypothetical protein
LIFIRCNRLSIHQEKGTLDIEKEYQKRIREMSPKEKVARYGS